MDRINRGRTATWLGAALAWLLTMPAPSADAATLDQPSPAAGHVVSPDWRDQVIYFLMIDRFDDGDPTNNDQGAAEYDPADGAKYSGGDLRGVTRRIDYIRGLGATAVWITPPVANQWWNVRGHFSGYHGYWAENFTQVDAHYGTLDDYKALSRTLHAAGMYLVQDIVVNHTANFFAYEGGWNAADPAAHFVLHPDSRGRSAPSQPPFDRNDARDPAQRAAGIYHWTPDITNFADRHQELDYQLAGLDDLNTENPVVRRVLRQSYGHWIREVGVDAFRVDTTFLVPPDFFPDFLHADDIDAPGILRVAEQTGRHDFHLFGEGFGLDKPYDDTSARKLDLYMRTPGGLPAMINYPLYGTLVDVFARGRPTAELGYRIRDMMTLHAHPQLMPTFVDNHDVDRFLDGGSTAGLKQALLATMTLPGIPVIYYGTEQGFTDQRGAMFAAGFHSGGHDRFDTTAPLYRFIQRATALRRTRRLFSHGSPTVLGENLAASGALAYRMTDGPASALVLFNSSDGQTLLDNLQTGLTPGTMLKGLFGIDSVPADIVVGADGTISMPLPARSGLVWEVTPRVATVPVARVRPRLDPLPDRPAKGDFPVRGVARGVASLRLVVDGNLATARVVSPDPDGNWQAIVDTGAMINASVAHDVVAWNPASATASAGRQFRVAQQWTPLADVADPAGDDNGPRGTYSYPTDPGWGTHRQLDIEHVRVFGSGGAVRIELRMHGITKEWNPPNGFDHVAFTVFVQIPGRQGGASVMPLQNASLPAGMRWHYRLRAHGWSNALFSAVGASASNEGTPVTPSADIRVDAAHDTITFTLPASALGNPKSLSGARLYVSTWDMDTEPRALTPVANAASFGGGHGAVDPLVMDDSGVLTLR